MPAGIGYGPAGMRRLQHLVATGRMTPQQAQAMIPAVMAPTPANPLKMGGQYGMPAPRMTPAMRPAAPPAAGQYGADPEADFDAFNRAIGRPVTPAPMGIGSPLGADPMADIVRRHADRQGEQMEYQAGRQAMRSFMGGRR